MLDIALEVPYQPVSRLAMALEIATILLGACMGAVAVLYAAPKGYLGHRKKKGSEAVASLETYTTATGQVDSPTVEVPATVEPAPSAVTPLYESVQPAFAPVTYNIPASTTFGGSTITKKPTRTYRRRSVPVRSSAVPKSTRTAKTKKR